MNKLVENWRADVDDLKATLYSLGEKGDSLHYSLLATEAVILLTCIADVQKHLLDTQGDKDATNGTAARF